MGHTKVGGHVSVEFKMKHIHPAVESVDFIVKFKCQCVNLTPEIVDEVMEDWHQQGKIWDVSPPTASHFGGVWERKIGQIRQVLQGYILTSDRRTLSSEELMTFLQQAARMVNSTPLWEAPDTSNDPRQLLVTI